MIERGGSSASRGIASRSGSLEERVWQNLDRDLALQPRIFRAYTLDLPPPRQTRDDLIRAEFRAGGSHLYRDTS